MRSLFGWRIPGGAYEQSGFRRVKKSAFTAWKTKGQQQFAPNKDRYLLTIPICWRIESNQPTIPRDARIPDSTTRRRHRSLSHP